MLEPLRLEPAEVEWLQALAPVAGSSPRRLLRLVNSYRLARTSLSGAEAQTFLAGGNKGFAALLALAAGAPVAFPALMAAVTANNDLAGLDRAWDLVAQGNPGLRARLTLLTAPMRGEDRPLPISPSVRS